MVGRFRGGRSTKETRDAVLGLWLWLLVNGRASLGVAAGSGRAWRTLDREDDPEVGPRPTAERADVKPASDLVALLGERWQRGADRPDAAGTQGGRRPSASVSSTIPSGSMSDSQVTGVDLHQSARLVSSQSDRSHPSSKGEKFRSVSRLHRPRRTPQKSQRALTPSSPPCSGTRTGPS